MEHYVGDRALKRLPQRRLNFIYGSISSFCYILNSPEQLEQIRQANKLYSILCDLGYDHTKVKEEEKKRAMEAEENRRRKSEEKKVRYNN